MLTRVVHPGEILKDKLAEMDVTPTMLARQIAVPPNRIGQKTRKILTRIYPVTSSVVNQVSLPEGSKDSPRVELSFVLDGGEPLFRGAALVA